MDYLVFDPDFSLLTACKCDNGSTYTCNTETCGCDDYHGCEGKGCVCYLDHSRRAT